MTALAEITQDQVMCALKEAFCVFSFSGEKIEDAAKIPRSLKPASRIAHSHKIQSAQVRLIPGTEASRRLRGSFQSIQGRFGYREFFSLNISPLALAPIVRLVVSSLPSNCVNTARSSRKKI